MGNNMQTNISEASSAVLNWCVAKCLGYEIQIINNHGRQSVQCRNGHPAWFEFDPTENWSDGGPIIDEKKICLYPDDPVAPKATFTPDPQNPHYYFRRYGETSLIAAMRCYVSSMMGESVEVPVELDITQANA